MGKSLFIFFVFFLFATPTIAQEAKTNSKKPEKSLKNQEVDSLKTNLRKEGIVIQDSMLIERKEINPLAPSKAAFYSAILPGLGQIYNKRYWKVPIVYAVIGTGVYAYLYNDDLYDRFRTAFKRRQAGFTDDEFWDRRNPDDGIIPIEPDLSTAALEDGQERYQRDRDLSLLVTIAMYALNIIDANVDAHLKQFNVHDDLSFDMRPYLDLDPISNNATYGMAFAIKF